MECMQKMPGQIIEFASFITSFVGLPKIEIYFSYLKFFIIALIFEYSVCADLE